MLTIKLRGDIMSNKLKTPKTSSSEHTKVKTSETTSAFDIKTMATTMKANAHLKSTGRGLGKNVSGTIGDAVEVHLSKNGLDTGIVPIDAQEDDMSLVDHINKALPLGGIDFIRSAADVCDPNFLLNRWAHLIQNLLENFKLNNWESNNANQCGIIAEFVSDHYQQGLKLVGILSDITPSWDSIVGTKEPDVKNLGLPHAASPDARAALTAIPEHAKTLGLAKGTKPLGTISNALKKHGHGLSIGGM